MAHALYDPTGGYYTRHVSTVGRGGDFSTSATLTPAFAGALTRWARAYRPRGEWHFIELGGGDGSLARAFVRALGWWERRKLRYHIVEISPRLAALQREKLAGCRVEWHPEIASALAAAGGAALIVGNEFVDAFPCAVLEFQDGIPGEIGVERAAGGGLRECLLPVREAVLASGSSALARQAGRVEIQTTFRDWLQAMGSAWQSGRMLLVDYGDTTAELYHRRPRGTLRAYFRHETLEGSEVLLRVGHQDLTADVNFTDLTIWAAAGGLRSEPLRTQREFLSQFAAASGGTAPDAADAMLADPAGAGSAFKVCEFVA